MSWLDRLRAWVWKAEEASNELEYSMLDEVHKAETSLDDATGGRLGETLDRSHEEAEELLETFHLEGEPLVPDAPESQPDERS